MPIESVTYISDFVATNPVGAFDAGSTLGNHIRNMKTGIKATFPNVSGAVSPTHTQLNQVGGTWTEKQTFGNYTVLGAGPAIKMKKLTGTTGAAQGDTTNVAHGVDGSKILSVSVAADRGDGLRFPPEHTFNAGYQYSVAHNAANVFVINSTANSSLILSKAFTVLVTYEE